jgi:zinc transport system substrate-binding protein
LVVLVVTALVAGGCAPAGGGATSDDLTVTVSIVPQQYFVERIGGDRVTVNVMVRPGNNPATYEPKPEQLKSLDRSVAYFSIGVPFEQAWLDRIAEANPDMVMVDTIADIERMPMASHHHHDEDEEGHADDDHSEDEAGLPDPHVWVSPALVKVQAQVIYEALAALDPESEAAYRANLDAFIADIEALEGDIQATLAELESSKFIVFHPAWGYFAHDFGLEQVPIEVGGQEPSAQELAALIEEAQEENIRVIFAQPEFSTSDAETIAREIGGEVLLISPLAPDWLANMRQVAEAFAKVLAGNE